MQPLKKNFALKFYAVETCTGAIVGLIVLTVVKLDSGEAQLLHKILMSSTGATALIGFFLYQKDVSWLERSGVFLTKIALNLFGFLLVLFP